MQPDGALSLTRVAGGLLAALMFLPLLFVAISVATAVFGIPAVLERLAAADYPGLVRARAGSQWVSAGIALAAGAVGISESVAP